MGLKRELGFVGLVLLMTLFIFKGFLGPGYPPSWGGDSYGHLFKVWKLTHGYSPWIEDWYGGYPFLRFYPPISYYLGALFGIITGSDVTGYKLTALLAVILGAVSMRFLLRELGFSDVPAYGAAMAYALAPYHLRVLSPEGNFPRFLGLNLAPLLLLALLFVWRGKGSKALLAGIFTALVILTHHTLVVTFGLLVLLFVPYLLAERPEPRKLLINLSIAGGTALLLSAFWVIPFLLERGQAHFLNENSIDYLFKFYSARLKDILFPGYGWSLYQGLLLYLGIVGAVLALRSREKRLLGAGVLAGIVLSIVLALGYYGPFQALNRLPLLDMIPPVRWLDPMELFAAVGFALLLEAVLEMNLKGTARKALPLLLLILILAPLTDVHLRAGSLKAEEFPSDYSAVLNYIANDDGKGWRYFQWGLASTEGSRIAYTPALTEKPILSGWYRQGDPAYPQHAYLNYAMANDPAYAEKALRAYSVKYVILDSRLPDYEKGVSNLKAIGFREVYSAGHFHLYSWKGWSFLIPKAKVLVVGSWPLELGAEYEMGETIDPYADSLGDYNLVVLNGYRYRDPLVWKKLEDYVRNGGVLVVNTFRSPDALSKRFGVRSVLVRVYGRANLSSPIYNVSAFSNFTYGGEPWTATAYEGNLTSLIKLGNLTVLGYKDVGKGRVYFIGLNLPYHAVYTKNDYEAKILRKLLEPYAEAPKVSAEVLEWSDGKIAIRYTVNRSTGVVLSENYYLHWRASADGKPVKVSENGEFGLIELSLPAGTHVLTLEFRDPYRLLRFVSLIGWVIAIAAALAAKAKR